MLWLVIVLSLTSCKKNKFEIDVDAEKCAIKIERLDRDFNNIDTNNVKQSIQQLEKKYGTFLRQYVGGVLALGNIDSITTESSIKGLLSDSVYKEIYKECQNIYGNTNDIENEIAIGMTYVKHYFPKKQIPRVAMHISGYNQSIVVSDGIMSVSIDNYLGSDYAPYQSMAYEYQIQKMNRDNVAMDLMYAYLLTEFGTTEGGSLLDNMISEGKLLYLMSIFMPNRTDKDIMGYTESQYKWCVDNEKQMWNYLIENKRLYNTSQLVISKFIKPAPFTSEFPQESPGQAALWLGMRIVENYMDANDDVTLEDLMKNKNSQQILEGSNYRP